MEKGVPLETDFTVGLPFGAAYDIVGHEPKSFSRIENAGKFSVSLNPGSGTIIVLLPRPVAGVELKVPETLTRGEDFTVEAFPADENGKPFKAVLPLEVTFTSGETVLPGTGFYATDKDGKLILRDTAALNMPTGKAVLTVKCLTSGKSISKEVLIKE